MGGRPRKAAAPLHLSFSLPLSLVQAFSHSHSCTWISLSSPTLFSFTFCYSFFPPSFFLWWALYMDDFYRWHVGEERRRGAEAEKRGEEKFQTKITHSLIKLTWDSIKASLSKAAWYFIKRQCATPCFHQATHLQTRGEQQLGKRDTCCHFQETSMEAHFIKSAEKLRGLNIRMLIYFFMLHPENLVKEKEGEEQEGEEEGKLLSHFFHHHFKQIRSQRLSASCFVILVSEQVRPSDNNHKKLHNHGNRWLLVTVDHLSWEFFPLYENVDCFSRKKNIILTTLQIKNRKQWKLLILALVKKKKKWKHDYFWLTCFMIPLGEKH